MSAPVETILVRGDETGLRVDRWFRVHFPEVGYSYLQKLLRSGQVRVELTIDPDPASPIPLEHGLPGTIEVEVDRVSPAALALRAVGKMLMK